MADPAALISAFDQYLAAPVQAAAGILAMSLGTLRGITSGGFNAGGSVPSTSAQSGYFQREGLPLDSSFDLWLVDNRPANGNSTLAEAKDRSGEVGSYQVQSEFLMLSATLPPDSLRDRCRIALSSCLRTRARRTRSS